MERIVKIPQISIIAKARTIPEAERIIGYESVREIFRRLYVDEGLSMREIARMIKKGPMTVHRALIRYEKEKILEVRPSIAPPYQGRLVPYGELKRRRIEYIEGKYVTMHYIYPFPEMSYIIGFALGDGTFSHDKVELCNTEFGFLDQILERAEKVANRFGVKAGYVYYDKEWKKVNRPQAYVWRIMVYSSALSRAIVTPEGEIKEEALNILLEQPFMGHFLAGLWDADGTTHFRPIDRLITITLSQSERNKTLLEKIASKLTAKDVSTSPPYRIEKAGKTHYFAKRPTITREDYYTIYVHVKGIPRWMELVGEKMLHPRKRKTLQKIKPYLTRRA